ncbi:MAG TPA: hypothetical protein DEP23_09870 [Ruminococcaceae bacterium]|jgi:hypothetical protein|nr:hypothetical protein [Oscillospiraceae bacterium]
MFGRNPELKIEVHRNCTIVWIHGKRITKGIKKVAFIAECNAGALPSTKLTLEINPSEIAFDECDENNPPPLPRRRTDATF